MRRRLLDTGDTRAGAIATRIAVFEDAQDVTPEDQIDDIFYQCACLMRASKGGLNEERLMTMTRTRRQKWTRAFNRVHEEAEEAQRAKKNAPSDD